MKGNVNIVYIICSIILILSIQVSCKNNKNRKEGNYTDKVVVKELKLVEVPPMMSNPESRSKYASEHFWDNFDFNDSTYLANRQGMNDHISTFFFVLANTTQDVIDRSFNLFIDKFLQGDTALRSYFMSAVESALHDPNSRIRNESLYISFLKEFINSRHLDQATKDKYSFQLELSLKNRPGAISIDFNYIDNKNRVSSLHKTTGRYLLIFFYEPGCPSCNSIKQGILDSSAFKGMESNLTYLAIYHGEDYTAWKESINLFPSNWIVAHDIGQEIVNDKLYDVRASPTMYLLDSAYKVLLKDPDLFQLDNYLLTLQN